MKKRGLFIAFITGISLLIGVFIVHATSPIIETEKKVETVALEFHSNGGKQKVQKRTVEVGTSIRKFPSASRSGATFLGWYSAKKGGWKLMESTKFTKKTKTVKYYAHWTPNSFSLDAKKLLFGAKNKTLTMKLSTSMKNVDLRGVKWTTGNKRIAVVSKSGRVTSKGYGKTTLTVSVGTKKKMIPVQVANKWVALTYDDGPWWSTPSLLSYLKAKDVDATFFLIGQNIAGRSGMLRQMVKDGHEIANHTWNHAMGSPSAPYLARLTDNKIQSVVGKRTKLFRPPGGGLGGSVRSVGKPIILWTVDPFDWRDRNASLVANRVLSQTRSGAIVLLHDIHPTSITASKTIIPTLEKRGYAFVTVSQLFGKPKNNVVYNRGSSKVRTMKIVN